MTDTRRRYHTARHATASLLYLVISLVTTTILVYWAVGTMALVRSVWAFFT